MKKQEITVPVRLDEPTFRRYCHFDTMLLHRRWLKPVFIGMVLITLGLAALLSGRPDYQSLAGVLVGLGIALPLGFVGLYFLQLRGQVAERKLKEAPAVYTVRLRTDDVEITNAQHEEAPIAIPWPHLAAAYRMPGCVYLYVNAEHAFLLPDGQANVSQDRVWACLKDHLGDARCFDRRRPGA